MVLNIAFAADSPPLSVIAAAKLAGVEHNLDSSLPSGSPPSLIFPDGSQLRWANVLLGYFGRIREGYGLCGHSAFDASQIDELLEYSSVLESGSGFENACAYLDNFLLQRTLFVGHSFSIADIGIWGGLAGTGQRWESLRKSKKYQNLVRWYNSVSSEYSTVLQEVTSLVVKKGSGKVTATKSKENDSKGGVNGEVVEKGKPGSRSTFEVDLPETEMGKVRLRFAPEPSGFLHIGHSKAALLNQYFADRYQGKPIIRFDDTNPAKESNEFVDNLLKDIETLGIKYETVTYTYDYFPQLMEMAEKLIYEVRHMLMIHHRSR